MRPLIPTIWLAGVRFFLAIGVWLACTVCASATTFSIADAQGSGSERSLTLQTLLQPASEDLGKSIRIFAIALVPSDQGGKLYARSAAGWQAVTANTAPSAIGPVLAESSHAVGLAQGDDATGLAGTTMYVGYGVDSSGSESALADMLRNGRYRLVYTFASGPAVTEWSLQPATEQGLKAYFLEALGPAGKSYLDTPWATDGIFTATPTTGAVTTSGAPVSVSGTTLQEAGVDEADRVKTDGEVVFSLAQNSVKGVNPGVLQRQRLAANAPDAALVPVDSVKLAFSPDVVGTGLYLDSTRQQVAVLGESASRWGIYDGWFAPQAWTQGATEVALIDTSSTSAMQTRRTLRINATLIGSRRLGPTLYLVLRSYAQLPGLDPWWPSEKFGANQTLLDRMTVSAVLPTLSINGGATQPLVDATACLTQPHNAFKSADIITLVAIDLAAGTHRHAARCFTGGTEAFYMSDQSLYLATTRSVYTYNGAFPVYSGQSSTDLHKFALNGLDMVYRGSGNVMGHLGFDQNRKSFRMGEHQGALRVITQSAPTWGGWLAAPVTGNPTPAVESPGHLSILQENNGSLVLSGELPNARRPAPLGKPGEQLYASRFLGKRGFLVTYRLTDPLYVLDLSNPQDPFISGELQVSGYSDYLFPLSETLLLGVGKEAISEAGGGDGRFAWYQGVKLSLIDLTDPSRPREAARSVIGKRGTDATVLHNHHGIAIATSGSKVRVGLPVNLHDTAPQPMTGAANDYYRFTRSELQKFDIDLGQKSLSPRPALPSSLAAERDISNDRSVLWNDQVHYYQDGVWRSGAW